MTERKVRSVKKALDDSLRDIDSEKTDQAVLALAKRYAVHIDENPGDLGKFGPLLLDSLRDLRMTPKSRASVMKGSGDDGSAQRSKWDELEQRRAARLDGAASGNSSQS